jgi:hypothetical protein
MEAKAKTGDLVILKFDLKLVRIKVEPVIILVRCNPGVVAFKIVLGARCIWRRVSKLPWVAKVDLGR